MKVITIQNIHQASLQEILDFVNARIITQGKGSIKSSSIGGSCRYREGELKCAVGHLIPDSKYRDVFHLESETSTTLFKILKRQGGYPAIDWVLKNENEKIELLSRLQSAHDNAAKYLCTNFIASWKLDLIPIVKGFNLINPNEGTEENI